MDKIGVIVVLMICIFIVLNSIILGIYKHCWEIWAIKVGKARYNQTTGLLEFDEK